MPNDAPDRRMRHFKNSIYGLLSWLFPIIPSIVVTPILVKSLGNEIYGLYIVVLGFISYFFTAGIGKAAAKYIAEYRSSGETEKISDVVSSTLMLSISLGLLGTGLTVLFARVIVADILLISPELQAEAILAVYLACATILVSTTSQIFQLILQGLQRFDKFLLLTNLSSFLLSLGSIALVLAGYSILALLIWTLIVAFIIGFISITQATRLLPEFRFSFRVRSDAWRSVWRYAASIIAYQICGNLLLLFERGWIVRKFGAEALTFYAVPMMLAMYIHLFTSSLILALFPAVNELLLERDKLIILYQKTSKFILMLIVFAVLSALIGGRLFLGLWISEEFANISYSLLVIHVLTFAVVAMNTIVWQIAESFKFAFLNALATLAWMALSIPLMVLLSDGYQSRGVALARFAGIIVFIPLIYYVEKRFLGGIFWRFWASISIKILVAAVLAAAAEASIIYGFEKSWLAFLLGTAVGAVVYGLTLITLGLFEADEKQLLRNLFVKFR